MPKSVFPWPAGLSMTFPTWRNRHIASGDTTPPTRPEGVGSTANRIPYRENGAASGPMGGSYDSETRLVGLGEEARAPNFNRGLYDLWAQVDSLLEKDDAVLDLISVTLNGWKYGLDDGAKTEKLVYLGPGGTTTTGGLDPGMWCSNYMKVRAYGGIDPLVNPATGLPYFITDVQAPPGTSFYGVPLPGSLEVYPYGTCARIATIVGVNLENLTFVTPPVPPMTAAPSGTKVPSHGPVGLLNYSLLERILAGSGYPVTEAFATCLSAVAGPPDVYTTNRNNVLLANLVAARWLVGDLVYTTYFALSPVVRFNAIVPGMDATLLLGTFASAGRGPAQRFMDLLRLADMPSAPVLPVVSTEPTGATYGSFDYANALFRARDGTLKGTVGFDADMASFSSAGNWDVYAGFLHRRKIAFDNAATTQIVLNAPCNYVTGTNTVTLTGADVFWTGSATGTHLILGVDLVELRDSLGSIVGLFTLATFTANPKEATLERLSGTIPALGVDVPGGHLSISRPVFRTGGMLGPGGAAIQGTILVGDLDSFGSDLPALTLFSGGATNLLAGYQRPFDARNDGTVGGNRGCVFRVRSYGRVSWGPTEGPYLASHSAQEMWHHTSSVMGEASPLRLRFADESVMADSAGDRAYFRDSVLLDSTGAKLNRVIATSFRTTPNSTSGLSQTGALGEIDFASLLVLGDPGRLFDPAGTNPNYGGVIAGRGNIHSTSWPPSVNGQDLFVGLFAQCDQKNVDYPYLFAGILDGNGAAYPPVGYPAQHRFILPAEVIGDRVMNYAWSEPRTFWHNIPMAAGQPNTTNTPTVPPWALQGGLSGVWALTMLAADPAQYIMFPLNLPDGATPTALDVRCYSSAAVGSWYASLIRRDYQNLDFLSLGEHTKVLEIGWNTLPVAGMVTAVRNDLYHYHVVVRFETDVVSTIDLHGLRVQYTMQDFLPA